ncbi:MAG: sulfatase [Acidobacteriota bacterium]
MLILLITLDCVRTDHLEGAGLTPNLDALAPEWTTFTEAFAQSQNTLSSHLSMLTSNYLCRHGVYSNYVRKDLPAHALSRRLAQRGFETRAFTSVDFLAQLLGNQVGQADARFPGAGPEGLLRKIRRRLLGPRRRARAGETLGAGLRWLLRPERRRDVFLWLHLFDAHMVYEAPRDFLRSHVAPTRADVPVREQFRKAGWFSPDFPEYAWKVPLEHFPQRYRAAVAYQDACLGRFFEVLKARGAWDESLVFLTADHGECLLGDHGVYCAHKKLFDTTVKVPLRVRFPGGRHAGERVDALVQHVDMAPTAASLAGFEEPLYEGRDLSAVAAGRDGGHSVVFAEHVDNFLRAARDREWVHVEQVPGSPNKWGLALEEGTLFRRDGAPAPARAAEAGARLQAALGAWLSSRPEIRAAWGEAGDAEGEIAGRLKELGYM